jgi:UDP-N-acetylmuramoylalanine--D-glutamate ligase
MVAPHLSSHPYRGATVLVIGLGRTGRAVARYLAACGATVRIAERRPAAELGDAIAELPPAAETFCGDDAAAAPATTASPAARAFAEGLLGGVSLVVPSPGVPVDLALLAIAAERRIAIVSEIELAARALTIPLIAITGTNGKSTTTTLVGEMLREGGERPFVGGNLGTPLISAVAVDEAGQATPATYSAGVVEVSSFQLEWVDRFHPRIGIFLNLSDDHLDRYADLDAYGETKLRLFARQGPGDVAILNGGDPWLRRHAGSLAARRIWFGEGEGVAIRADAAAIRLRLDDRDDEVYPLQRVSLAGAHNRENMMAAIVAARTFGVAAPVVRRTLESFRGLEHRLELVRERGGVRWVNDSKGTNPGAVIKSLEGHSGDVILLAGGIEKGGDYGVLRAPVARAVRHALVFGAAKAMLARTLADETAVEVVDSLETAVARAATVARPGDTVLLSPACASFDMFRDYADRGRRFKALVEALP